MQVSCALLIGVIGRNYMLQRWRRKRSTDRRYRIIISHKYTSQISTELIPNQWHSHRNCYVGFYSIGLFMFTVISYTFSNTYIRPHSCLPWKEKLIKLQARPLLAWNQQCRIALKAIQCVSKNVPSLTGYRFKTHIHYFLQFLARHQQRFKNRLQA